MAKRQSSGGKIPEDVRPTFDTISKMVDVEFTWDGNDEASPAQGRGWAILDGNEIKGMIFIHQGVESEFKAEKKAKRKS